jgi:hypothetical protein
MSDLTLRQAWRIQDQSWQLDVSSDSDIPYRDAEQIVLAIRRRQLVNHLPTQIGFLRLNTAVPEIDADEIRHISRYKSEAAVYEVRTGQAAGFVLQVRIVDDRVELQNYGTWIA